MNAVGSFLHHLWGDNPRKWYPLLSVYYLTYACRFRCSHCSDGSGEPYYRLKSEMLSGKKAVALLREIRRHSEYLVITGGEPLEHPDFAQIMEGVKPLKYRGVILTTNGYSIEPFLNSIATSVHHLVFSLQTLDSRKGDAGYGGRAGVHPKVLANIERAASYPGRKYEIIISSVVTPGNIPDLYEVYHFAQKRGFRLAACPQLMGVKAHPAFAANSNYREFFDFLIAEKRKGGLIQGTVDYLKYMRDLEKFSCRPFTMLIVSSLGDVFYPCLELGQFAGNLLDEPNLHRLRQKGFERHGPQPDCDTRCHSACALGFSRLLEK
ncbi:MAG TPA: radical SAM protein, partial [Clostridia bacterium]|nr:radical SAM protein [Clostridia bacterium]